MFIFTRYYLREILNFFFIALTIGYCVSVSFQFFFMVGLFENTNVNLLDIFELFMLNYPVALNLIFLPSFYFAIFFATNALSSSSELVSVRALGYSYNRLFFAVGVLAFFMGVFLILLNFLVMPHSNYLFYKKNYQLLTTKLKLNFLPGSINVINGNLVFFENIEEGKMQNIIIKPSEAIFNQITQDEKNQTSNVGLIWAKSLQLDYADKVPTFFLNQGSYIAVNHEETHFGTFDSLTAPMSLAQNDHIKRTLTFFKDEKNWGDIEKLAEKQKIFWSLSDLYKMLNYFTAEDEVYKRVFVQIIKRLEPLLIILSLSILAAALGISMPRFGNNLNVVILFILVSLQTQASFRILSSAQSVNSLLTWYGLKLFFFYFLTFLVVYLTNRGVIFNLNSIFKLKFKKYLAKLRLKPKA